MSHARTNLKKKTDDLEFAQDVAKGLAAPQKHIPSKYFYDAEGDRLFREIMALPEYYPTKTELGILTNFREEILNSFAFGKKPFNLIELGAGDGMKTKVLLRHFADRKATFSYSPIDISANALIGLSRSVAATLPELYVNPVQGDYLHALANMGNKDLRKVVLFLGASIGNFTFDQAGLFLTDLYAKLAPGDLVLIGFDLRKNPFDVLRAYNDRSGVTRDFNLNILNRINRELGGNFAIEKFEHYPTYDPLTGEAKSFLVSLEKQKVKIEALSQEFKFNDGEVIHTEVSKKYTLTEIDHLAALSGFTPVRNFSDPRIRFTDALWEV